MNRHPYGGYDAPVAPRRRSASPPFRTGGGGYRGRGGGGPRGRGGYSGGRGGGGDPGYDSYGAHPAQQQDPYDLPPPAAYAPPPMNNGDYSVSQYGGPPTAPRDPYFTGGPSGGPPEFEDYSYGSGGGGGGSDYNRGGYENGRGRGGPLRGGAREPRPPRQRDDKVHDSIIEERINRERPCRTLFIRNIKYESSSDRMRAKFEEHGEIKTFFDIIKTRGMVFVTYFDLRAAEKARDRLQGMDVSGRPIDVHYSLPREHELSQRCDREKNQGTLLVTLVGSPSRQAIDENELRRKMQQFGEVKTIKPIFIGGAMRPDQRLVEMYDSRACVHAHDRLRDQGLQDGIMDLEFEWDVPDQPLPPGPVAIPIGSSPRSPPRFADAPRAPPYRGGSGSDRGGDWGDRPPRGGPAAPYRGGGGGDYPPPSDRGRDYPPTDYRRGSSSAGGGGFPPMSPIGDRASAPYAAARGSDYGGRRDDRDRDRDRHDRDRDRGRPDDRVFGEGRRDEWGGRRRGNSPLVARPPPLSAGPTDEFGRALPNGGGRMDSDRNEGYSRPPSSAYPPYSAPPGPTSSVPTAAQTAEERLEQAKKVQQLLAALKPSAPALPPPQALSAPGAYYGGGNAAPLQSPYAYGAPPPPSSYPPTSTYQPQLPPAASPTGDMQSLLALLAQNQASQNPHQPR